MDRLLLGVLPSIPDCSVQMHIAKTHVGVHNLLYMTLHRKKRSVYSTPYYKVC